MINTALVGTGWWGKVTSEAVQGKSQRVRFTRAVTLEPEEVEGFAKRHGMALTTNYDDVLKDKDIDAVALLTPHGLHKEQILKAFKAGKHVFCEKPLTMTRKDAEAVVRESIKTGLVLGVGNNRRLWPPIVEMKHLIQSGALGEIMHIEGHLSHDLIMDLPPWRLTEEHSPGGGMTPMGIHLTDAFHFLMGEVESVYATLGHRAIEQETGDTAAALIKFKNGASGTLATSIITAPIWRIQVIGSEGWAMTDTETRLSICKRGAQPDTREFKPRKTEPADSILTQYESFASAVEGIAPYHIPPNQMVHNIALFEAILKSMKTGKIEKVPATGTLDQGKKASGKKSTAQKSSTLKSTGQKSSTRKSSAKKSSAKKTTGKKTTAKKSGHKTAQSRKTTKSKKK